MLCFFLPQFFKKSENNPWSCFPAENVLGQEEAPDYRAEGANDSHSIHPSLPGHLSIPVSSFLCHLGKNVFMTQPVSPVNSSVALKEQNQPNKMEREKDREMSSF